MSGNGLTLAGCGSPGFLAMSLNERGLGLLSFLLLTTFHSFSSAGEAVPDADPGLDLDRMGKNK